MEIKQVDNHERGYFQAEDNGREAGLMTYVYAGPKKLIIDHTEVDEAYAGQGVGSSMVEKAVDFARQKDYKILPLCPFAKSVFNKTPDYNDVLLG